jgi:hypothetical protein
LTPETLTAHVLHYTNATRKRADNVPVLKKGAGFFRTIQSNPGLADAASRTVFGKKIQMENSKLLGAIFTQDNSLYMDPSKYNMG